MTPETFDKFLDYVWEKHIKGVMSNKSKEYARGNDKLYNFKRAGQMANRSSLEALRGMKLKHDVSIDDMLNDEDDMIVADIAPAHPQELWEEKLHDEINYLLLLWALLYEKYDWKGVDE